MLQLERQKHILKYLEENRKATTNELSEMLVYPPPLSATI